MASTEYASYPAWKLEIMARRQKENGDIQGLKQIESSQSNKISSNHSRDSKTENESSVIDSNSQNVAGNSVTDFQSNSVSYAGHVNDIQNVDANVVFEHIVPRTVKQMWLNATSLSGGKPTSDGLSYKNMGNTKPSMTAGGQMSFRKVSSIPLGGIIVSKDIAAVANFNGAVLSNHQEKGLRGPEDLAEIANTWGVKLRHVRPKDESERLLELKLQQRRNSNVFASDEHTAPHDESWLNLSPRLKNFERERSSSLQGPNADTIVKDVAGLASVDISETSSESHFHALSIRKRRDSFEHHSTAFFTPPVFDKFAPLISKSSKSLSDADGNDYEIDSVAFVDHKREDGSSQLKYDSTFINEARETEYGYSNIFPHVDSFVNTGSSATDVPSRLHPKLRLASSSDIEKDIVPKIFQRTAKSQSNLTVKKDRAIHHGKVYTLKSFTSALVPVEPARDVGPEKQYVVKASDIPVSVIDDIVSDFDECPESLKSSVRILPQLKPEIIKNGSAASSTPIANFLENGSLAAPNVTDEIHAYKGRGNSPDTVSYNKLGQVVLAPIYTSSSAGTGTLSKDAKADIRAKSIGCSVDTTMSDGNARVGILSTVISEAREENPVQLFEPVADISTSMSSAQVIQSASDNLQNVCSPDTENSIRSMSSKFVPVSVINTAADLDGYPITSSSSTSSPYQKPRIIGKACAAIGVSAESSQDNISTPRKSGSREISISTANKVNSQSNLSYSKLGQVVLEPLSLAQSTTQVTSEDANQNTQKAVNKLLNETVSSPSSSQAAEVASKPVYMEEGKPSSGSFENVRNRELVQSTSQQKRRVGKLIILSGDARNEQLKNLNPAKQNVRQVKVKVEHVNTDSSLKDSVSHVEKNIHYPGKGKDMDGFALTFLSNTLDDPDVDTNEPIPKAPDVIFNGPLVKLKSLLTSQIGNDKRKRLQVSFNSSKLAIVHSYPSEESLMLEYDGKDFLDGLSQAPTSGLGSYQPQTVSDLGTVLQRERQRIDFSSKGKDLEMQSPTVVKLSAEGDHFNSHAREGGHGAMLF